MNQQQLPIKVQMKQILGRRGNQEDAMGFSSLDAYPSRGFLCVVSDGMGGMARGEEYSQSAVSEILAAFAQMDPSASAREILLSCYARARKAALALRAAADDADGGATLVMVYVRDNHCTLLSVGDSRIYLLRKGGLIQLNREQTLGPMLDERAALGVISAEMAAGNLHRASLLNHTNAETPMLCDMNSAPFALIPGDRLILMSDGVFGVLSEAELTRLLNDGGENTAAAILAAVEQKNNPKQDNSSVAIVDILSR